MEDFLQNKLKKAEDFIENTSNVNLFDANFETDLYTLYQEKKPYLDKEKYRKSIESEVIATDSGAKENKHNGETLEFVLIQVLIVNVTDYFKDQFADLFDTTKKLFINNDVLVFKQFAEMAITNNAAIISQINEEATVLYANFESRLNVYNLEIDQYNVQLLDLITTQSNEQRRLRNYKANSEDLINPF